MSLSASNPSEIREFGQLILSARIAVVFGLGVIVTDIFHTFPREVEFYWNGRWAMPRILYFLIRYTLVPLQCLNTIAFFGPPSDTVSKIFPNVQFCFDLLVIWSVQAILIYRIHAVYSSRRLLQFLIALFFLTAATEATLGYVGINLADWEAQPFPTVRYCSPTNFQFLQRTHWLTWVPTLLIDSVLFLLAVYKLYQYQILAKDLVFKRTLVSTLLHDSIVYFASLVLMAGVYMIVARVRAENGEVASNIIFPFISACGCRLLFHLRSRERAQMMGALTNGDLRTGYTDATTQPIEFRVFSGPAPRMHDAGFGGREDGFVDSEFAITEG